MDVDIYLDTKEEGIKTYWDLKKFINKKIPFDYPRIFIKDRKEFIRFADQGERNILEDENGEYFYIGIIRVYWKNNRKDNREILVETIREFYKLSEKCRLRSMELLDRVDYFGINYVKFSSSGNVIFMVKTLEDLEELAKIFDVRVHSEQNCFVVVVDGVPFEFHF